MRGLFQKGFTVLLSILFVSCVTIRQSGLRSEPTAVVALKAGLDLYALGAVNIHVPFIVDHVDFFPAGFKIKSTASVIYIDPVHAGEQEPADIIFITHSHADHFSLPDIQNLSDRDTVVVCPQSIAGDISEVNVLAVQPGEKYTVAGLKFETVPAYNTRTNLIGISAHAKSDGFSAYVIDVDGFRIFHAGDSDVTEEFRKLSGIDVALVPIDGGDLTMSTLEAAELVNKLRPKLAIPMHYELASDAPALFQKQVSPDIQVRLMHKQ